MYDVGHLAARPAWLARHGFQGALGKLTRRIEHGSSPLAKLNQARIHPAH
jgi:hypothetical protein